MLWVFPMQQNYTIFTLWLTPIWPTHCTVTQHAECVSPIGFTLWLISIWPHVNSVKQLSVTPYIVCAICLRRFTLWLTSLWPNVNSVTQCIQCATFFISHFPKQHANCVSPPMQWLDLLWPNVHSVSQWIKCDPMQNWSNSRSWSRFLLSATTTTLPHHKLSLGVGSLKQAILLFFQVTSRGTATIEQFSKLSDFLQILTQVAKQLGENNLILFKFVSYFAFIL